MNEETEKTNGDGDTVEGDKVSGDKVEQTDGTQESGDSGEQSSE